MNFLMNKNSESQDDFKSFLITSIHQVRVKHLQPLIWPEYLLVQEKEF